MRMYQTNYGYITVAIMLSFVLYCACESLFFLSSLSEYFQQVIFMLLNADI